MLFCIPHRRPDFNPAIWPPAIPIFPAWLAGGRFPLGYAVRRTRDDEPRSSWHPHAFPNYLRFVKNQLCRQIPISFGAVVIKSLGPTEPVKQWHRQVVDRGVLAFDRGSGTNVLLRSAATTGLRRCAPRVLQIGLLTTCNLRCGFCYRDPKVPNRLDAGFLLDLLRRAADWGVLEVAFGGGEPLMYPGLLDILQQLHEQTPLGVNLTTNGTLLSLEIVAQLTECVGEIRISAYPDNHYRRTLRMLAGKNVGINWLVTPANIGLVEPYVRDFSRSERKTSCFSGTRVTTFRYTCVPRTWKPSNARC